MELTSSARKSGEAAKDNMYESVSNEKPPSKYDDRKISDGIGHWYVSWWAMVHNQSKRDIQVAFQMTCAFVFAALIGLKSALRNNLQPAWILTVLAPLLLGESLGMTVIACRGAIVNFIPAAIFIYILQILGMGYHTYTSSCIIFFLVCFWMGYVNPSMASRKIALLLPAVMIVTIVNTPNALLPRTFIWQFVGECCLAMCVDLTISLFLIPRYASLEVTERFHYTLQRNVDVLELLFNAMLSEHKAESKIYLCEADELVRCMQENQDALGMRSFVGSYEPVAWLRALFRRNQVVYNRFALTDFVLMNSTMFWHVSCLIRAVQEIDFNEYHASTWYNTRSACQDIIIKYRAVVRLLGDTSNSYAQDTTTIDTAIAELKIACDHMYAVLARGLKYADNTVAVHDDKNNNTGTGIEEGLLKEVDDSSPAAAVTAAASLLQSKKKQLVEFDADARAGANRLSGSFFLFHFSELMQSIDNYFTTVKEVSPASAKEGTTAPQPPAAAPAAVAKTLMTTLAFPFVYIGTYCSAMFKSYTVDVKVKATTGLRTAMLLSVGLIFCEVPKLVMKFENGQWILLAMMMSQNDNFGGTLFQARNRFLGTLAGAVYAYFVEIAVGSVDVYKIIGMFIPCLIVAGLLKSNRQWAYFGSVFVTTGLLMTFGRSVAYPVLTDFILLRIQENVVGILLAFIVTFMMVPIRATVLLKSSIVMVLGKLSTGSEKILIAFNKHVIGEPPLTNEQKSDDSTTSINDEDGNNASVIADCDIQWTLDRSEMFLLAKHKRVQNFTYILAETMAVSRTVSQQPLLLEQAVMELIFISKPLPELTFSKLIGCQRKLLHMMISIDRSLLRISQFTDMRVGESSLQFGKRVSAEMRELLQEVTSCLDKWSKQMQDTLDSSSTVAPTDHAKVAAEKNHDIESNHVPIEQHLESRLDHARNLEKIHKSALLLAENCLSFNSIAWKGWEDTIISAVQHSNDERQHCEAARIHHLFDVLTTFNALFYASNQLASSTMELGNVIYTILTLEKKINHKPF